MEHFPKGNDPIFGNNLKDIRKNWAQVIFPGYHEEGKGGQTFKWCGHEQSIKITAMANSEGSEIADMLW